MEKQQKSNSVKPKHRFSLNMSKKKNKNDFEKTSFFIKNKDLIYRIVFTLLVLAVIRAGMYLTVPGIYINPNYSQGLDNVQFFQLLATLGGGSIGKFSILALGCSPFITASIIVQLLSTDVVPVLSGWAKSGERGRKKLDRLTKILMIPFAVMQGEATIFTLVRQGIITPKWEQGSAAFYYILVPLIMLAGSYFMLWIADQITVRGIGNGVSVVIFVGIVAAMPNNIKQTYTFWIGKSDQNAYILFEGILKFLIYMVAFLVVIYFIVIINEAERKIPIQQTGSGLVDAKDHTPYLPLKLNNAGVIPVIFASAIISTPVTISQIIATTNENSGFVWFTNHFLSFDAWWGIAIYALMAILFTFLYSQVQINPEKVSENFQKSGTFIPGIKPGKDTTKFLQGTINRLSMLGSITLATIAVLPYVISKLTNLPSSLAIGGTGLIICISVVTQTAQQIRGRIIQQQFIEKKKEKFGDKTDQSKRSTHIW